MKKFPARLLLLICIISLLSVAVFAEDCHDLSTQWFGIDGNDASVLNIHSLNNEVPELDTLLDQLFAVREAAFTGAPVAYAAGDSLPEAEDDRVSLVAGLEDRINSVITDAKVDSFITALEITDNGYIATVYEWTFFDYDDLSDGKGGSDTAGYGTTHQITFVYNESGRLEIVSDDYVESEVLTGILSDSSNDVIEADTVAAGNARAISYVDGFDPVKSSIYANKWVTHENLDENKDSSYYNPEYTNWNPRGGDCANFVSQCLYAGNFPTNGTWYKDSKAWIACTAQYSFLKSYGKTVLNPTEDDVYPGAPLYFGSSSSDLYHVVICTGHNSAGTPVINGHNYDRYRVPWNYSVESLYALIQLTSYEIEDMTFEADSLIAYKDLELPLYTYYMDETPATKTELHKGDELPVVTGFVVGDTQWIAYDADGTIYYAKVGDGLLLRSQAPEVSLSLSASSVTTNDYLTVTASVSDEKLSSATLTITDADGQNTSVSMTCTDGAATATVDCQDFAPGTLRVVVTGSGETWTDLVGTSTVKVTAANVVKEYDGATLLWELDKTTGALAIYEPVSSANWIRFADKISTVNISRKITELPENAFKGCHITTFYGSQDFLSELAEKMGATHVVMGYFMDVFPDHWAFETVNEAFEKGFINGKTEYRFDTEGKMTRAMFVTVLGRMAGVDADEYPQTQFTDVPGDAYYAGYVGWATEKGIVKGKTTTTFAPDDNVTREQAVTMITRYLEAYNLTLPDAENPAEEFPDMDDVSDYAKESVEWARIKGIIKGHDTGNFNPQGTLTRAQATAMLLRTDNAAVENTEPEEPAEPTEPEKPEDPETPVTPEDPEEPETPVTPETPEEPEDPEPSEEPEIPTAEAL